MSGFDPVRQLIDRVRARWRRLVLLQSATRASLALGGVFALALVAAAWTTRAPLLLSAVAAAAALAAAAGIAWAFWPARDVPSDTRVARFVEEREESLDDRLVSAAELASSAEPPTTIGRLFTDDIARRAAGVDPGVIVPPETLRRAGLQATLALLLVAAIVVCRPRHDSRGGRRVGAPAVSVARRPPGHARQRPPALGFAADD